MSLDRFLAEERLKKHQTSRREIRDLLRVVDRDLADAAVTAISVDLRYQTASQACLQLATIVLAASGVRTSGAGHHWTTFKVLPELLGNDYQELADYFDQCRGKRNLSDYDRAGEISREEAIELLEEATTFKVTVLAWLKRNHPELPSRR